MLHCATQQGFLQFRTGQGEQKFKYLTFINVMKMPLNKHGENKTGKPQCKHTHTPTMHTHTHSIHIHKRPHRTIHLSRSLSCSFFSLFYCGFRKMKKKGKPAQIGKDLGKCEQKKKKMCCGKQLLANTYRIK